MTLNDVMSPLEWKPATCCKELAIRDRVYCFLYQCPSDFELRVFDMKETRAGANGRCLCRSNHVSLVSAKHEAYNTVVEHLLRVYHPEVKYSRGVFPDEVVMAVNPIPPMPVRRKRSIE